MSCGAKRFRTWCVLTVAWYSGGGGASAQVTVIDDFESGTLDDWTVRCGDWEIISPGHDSSFAVSTTGTCCCGESADKKLDHNSFIGGFGRYSFDILTGSGQAYIGHPDFQLQQTDDCNLLWIQLISSAHVSGPSQFLVVVHADFTTAGCAQFPLAVDTWYTVVVERYSNGVVRVYVDGNLAMEGFDTSVSQPGSVGLWAHSCGMRYDNITFDPSLPPAPPPTQPSCPSAGGFAGCNATLCCNTSICGDSKCCPGEDSCSCPSDCGGSCCGNNIREGAEECDGTNDAVCPGQCRADCTCLLPESPAVSEWGLVVLPLLLLIAMTIKLYQRRVFAA